ncbi:MAG: PIN domain-containing protein [Pseudomonadota bacterium]
MQHKRLVIDANILIRSVLGSRAMQLIHDSVERVAFYIAEDNYREAEYYLAQIAAERSIDELIWRASLESVMRAVQLIGQDELKDMKAEALARIAQRDADDWPALAAAMLLDCPVWTEDKDFFGSGVATWTTATVPIYLFGA